MALDPFLEKGPSATRPAARRGAVPLQNAGQIGGWCWWRVFKS